MTHDAHASCSLLSKTRELLKQGDKTYLVIYEETGLTPNWLAGVATGKIANPSVNRVQKLYEHLAQRALTV